MRRVFFVLLMALLAMSVFAEAVVEEEVSEITILTGYTYGENLEFTYAVDRFHEDYPDVAVVTLPLDLSTGAAMSMDALSRAGTPPNVYHDYTGRISKYLLPGYAFPLDDVVRDLDQYNPGVLDPFRKDGALLGIPDPSQCNGMAINLDIMAEIGYTVEPDWTVDDFLEMCELVKQFYGGEKFGTFMYAATQSGDYMINTWWGAFGAEMYASGDYTRTTIRETGGAEVYEFYQLLMSNGYIHPGAATLKDGESFAAFGCGKFAAVPFFPSWVVIYRDVGTQAGFDEFPIVFMPFPSATGVPVPAYATGSSSMVVQTGTAADVVAARLVEYIGSSGAQDIRTVLSGIPPNRQDTTVVSDDPYYAQTGAIAATNGLQDVGLTGPLFAAVRAQHYPILQKVLDFDLTPEEAILEYETRVNEVLAE